jgi:hypothetical protein
MKNSDELEILGDYYEALGNASPSPEMDRRIMERFRQERQRHFWGAPLAAAAAAYALIAFAAAAPATEPAASPVLQVAKEQRMKSAGLAEPSSSHMGDPFRLWRRRLI